ncbi:hypothetical protein LJC46_03370 [Desulfovibrio sp. OttesenSCG-928-G15]|nr:hypothetical protein [Desulfovibrio sp. OttesenSCG-928-G15]
MSIPPTPPATLVALNAGLPCHVDCLTCDDIRGSHSLFGESGARPKPLGPWKPEHIALDSFERRAEAYKRAMVLWKCEKPFAAEPTAIAEAMREDSVGLDVPATTFIAGKASSSFSVAWALVHDGLLPEWGAVLCSCQEDGRGQLRRPWHSPRGNLYVTFRLPGVPVFSGDTAALAAGYMIVTALRSLGFPVMLKWPNDLILGRNAKIGGILLEERENVVLAGLGINLCEAPSMAEMREATAVKPGILLAGHCMQPSPGLFKEENEPLPPFGLWRLLARQAVLFYKRSMRGREERQLMLDIDSLLVWKDEDVLFFEQDDAPVNGRCEGLGPGGGIMLRLNNGDRQEFFSGSLSLPS